MRSTRSATHTDLEVLRIRQRPLRCDHLVLGAIDLKAFHLIQRNLGGLGGDFVGGAPRVFVPQLVGRHLACTGHARNEYVNSISQFRFFLRWVAAIKIPNDHFSFLEIKKFQITYICHVCYKYSTQFANFLRTGVVIS